MVHAQSRREFLQTGGLSLGAISLSDSASKAEKSAILKKLSTLHAGFAAADITPSIGMAMPGGFFRATIQGVCDHLWAVACVIENGTVPVALVGTDTLFISRSTVEEARRRIQGQTSIPGENILIGASHTHTGGPVGEVPTGVPDTKYLAQLADAITTAVMSAWKARQPVEIGIGTGMEGSISFNRRFIMRDGREITHPGKPGTPHHVDIVRPAGPIDPDIGVLAARDAQRRVVGIVVNFACHNTVMGGLLASADYVGQLRKHLRDHYGPQTPVVFLLGACGDITQVDNRSTAREFGPEHADLMGMKLAAETIRTIDRMAWQRDVATAVATRKILLPVRAERDPDRERPAFGLGSGKDIEPVYARGRQLVAELRSKSPQVPTEIQAIRIGPLGIVTNGSEYFCDYGLRMKQCSPFQPTWMVSLANDVLGYVPTPQAFVAGGYEPRTTYWSRFAVDAGQLLLEAGLAALGKVRTS
jgi:neutral ceramidase